MENSLPSSSFAMTIPLPARAEKRKPALKTVKMAKPFAFSRTLRGMTCLQFVRAVELPSGTSRTYAI